MAEDKTYNQPQLEEDELEIDLMEYVRKLWAARMNLLKVAGVAAIIGLIVTWSMPTKYQVNVLLSPESGSSSSNSALSGMAAMLGFGSFNMGGNANGVNFSMAPEIVASTPFLLELYHTPVKTARGCWKNCEISALCNVLPRRNVFHLEHFPTHCPGGEFV